MYKTKSVISLCFSADNKRLIFITEDDPQIGMIDLLDENANITYFTHEEGKAKFVYSSPYRSEDFMVGGDTGETSSIVLYRLNIEKS